MMRRTRTHEPRAASALNPGQHAPAWSAFCFALNAKSSSVRSFGPDLGFLSGLALPASRPGCCAVRRVEAGGHSLDSSR